MTTEGNEPARPRWIGLADLKREWSQARQRSPRALVVAIVLFCVMAIGTIGGGLKYVTGLMRGLPDGNAISRIGEMDQATAVYDDHDQLVFTIFKEQRMDVPLSRISPNVIRALLSIEDQRFYQHHGFDAIRIFSAALANVRHRRAVQGGSTITQQLARQSFLSPDKTLRRKLQELILAERLEHLYTKQQILELYLNKVYFGDGLYGVEAASRGYFGKHASELDLSEAAVLAGLVKSPSTYAPTISKERALARRNVVLQSMLDSGVISAAQWKAARGEHLVLANSLQSDEPHGQYFKEQVRLELVERFGWQRVYQGGLRVFSTIDMPMQEAAEAGIAESLASLSERRKALAAKRKSLQDNGDPLQAALIALDPATGHVRAMVGGRDFEESHFNRAVQAHRQPGSAFKPFVYAAALEAGFTPATMIDHLNDPIATLQGDWTPEDEHSTASALSLRTALRTSSNRAAVRLLQEVGIPRTVEYARNLGVGDVPSVPSLALGSGEVTLESMTAAYAAFANHGLVPRPQLIRRVEDTAGKVLFEEQPAATRAITDATAFLMSSMMADVINAGTGNRARRMGFLLPAAGKTGTTNDFNDAWFVGFTPTLVAGVWVGFDQPHTILPNGFAADVAVPIWAAFMKAATKGDKPDWLSTPSNVTTANVCRLSGKLASDGCYSVDVVNDDGRLERRSMVYTEYFARGTQPELFCDLHPTRGFFGKIAGLFGAGEKPAPPHLEETGIPAAAASSGHAADRAVNASDVAKTATVEQPKKKKRGFWAKVFGIGKDESESDKDESSKPKKKGPGQ